MSVDVRPRSGMLGTNLSAAASARRYPAAPGPYSILRSDAMQCPVCHNEVSPQNAFCNHCGAPMAAAAAQAAPCGSGAAQPPPTYVAQPVAASSGLSDNAAGPSPT